MSRTDDDCVCVVTGASGGLGEALAVAAARRGFAVVLVGRESDRFTRVKSHCESITEAPVELIAVDLGTARGVHAAAGVLRGGMLLRYRRALLFNNASTIEPIESLANLTFEDMEKVLRVNVSAAVALSAALVSACSEPGAAEASIVNISSGVSINPVTGWAAYCVSKAALNMVAKCVAAETASIRNPVYSLSINPGPLDTRMQEQIRNADSAKSPAAEKFSRMHAEGRLKRPEDVAARIFEVLDSRRFASGDFVDFNLLG